MRSSRLGHQRQTHLSLCMSQHWQAIQILFAPSPQVRMACVAAALDGVSKSTSGHVGSPLLKLKAKFQSTQSDKSETYPIPTPSNQSSLWVNCTDIRDASQTSSGRTSTPSSPLDGITPFTNGTSRAPAQPTPSPPTESSIPLPVLQMDPLSSPLAAQMPFCVCGMPVQNPTASHSSSIDRTPPGSVAFPGLPFPISTSPPPHTITLSVCGTSAASSLSSLVPLTQTSASLWTGLARGR